MKGLLKSFAVMCFLFSTAVVFHACQSQGTTKTIHNDTLAAQISTGIESLDQFLSGFESAVRSHNTSQVLNCLDKDYKKEQYEKQMKFNTDSFMNAFFSNYQMEKSSYRIIFKNINKLTRTDAKVLAGTYTMYSVTYTIWAGNVSQSLTLTVFSRLDKGVLKHAIYGPVGS